MTLFYIALAKRLKTELITSDKKERSFLSLIAAPANPASEKII